MSTFRDYVRVLFLRKDTLMVSMAAVLFSTVIGAMLMTPLYEARVKLLISGEKQVQSPYYRDIFDERNVEKSITQSEIVISEPVLTRAVRALALQQRQYDYEKKYATPLKKWVIETQHAVDEALADKGKASTLDGEQAAIRGAVDDLRGRIKVLPVRDTNLFVIKVRDLDPREVALTANIVSRSYIIFDLEQQLAELTLKYGNKHPSVIQLSDAINQMAKNLNEASVSNIDAIGPASVKIIEQAEIPLRPMKPTKSILLVLGFILSIFFGITFAFMSEYMDPTFRSPAQIEAELGLPVLGSLLRTKKREGKLVRTYPTADRRTRLYQLLCDQLYLLMKDKGIKSVLVVAADGGEKPSDIMANLGAFLAERADCQVLLVDANLRHPSIHNVFNVENTKGFADVIEGRSAVKDVVQEVGKGLHLIVAGNSELNPALLLDSPKVVETVADVLKRFRVVLLDGPDLTRYRDSLSLASLADAVVVIVNEGEARRYVVKSILQPLVDRKVNILGIIMNNRTFPIPHFVYEKV